MRFHGDISAFIASNPAADTCKEDVEASGDPLNERLFRGQCVSRPGGFVGSFSVQIIDNGTPGSLDDDYIEVRTPSITDIFNPNAVPCTDTGIPYTNSGFIGGGNISSIGH